MRTEDLLVKAEYYSKKSILLTFESGEKRVLDINRLFNIGHNPHLSDKTKQRWKNMYDNGDFFNYEIVGGDLVWQGWVEIFASDIKNQTVELDIYKYFENSEKIFVHYGAKHFDCKKFIAARNNREGCYSKPLGGLWGLPISGEHTWIKWCLENEFREYDSDNCFYFRLNLPWITIHNKKEWEMLPKRDSLIEEERYIDFEALKKYGIDGWPIKAIEIAFDDYDEFIDCFPGYGCDSVLVLDDAILIENYDAKYSSNPIKLTDLKPIYFYKEIRNNVSVSCLLRSPDEKVYVYVEEPDAHYGFKILVACISDERIVEMGGYSEEEALAIIEEVKPYKKELELIFEKHRVLLV
jgi:hypothetical protein